MSENPAVAMHQQTENMYEAPLESKYRRSGLISTPNKLDQLRYALLLVILFRKAPDLSKIHQVINPRVALRGVHFFQKEPLSS